MKLDEDFVTWYDSDDAAHFVPEGTVLLNPAGPCYDCGQHHDGYEPDPLSPIGQYHSEQCPNE